MPETAKLGPLETEPKAIRPPFDVRVHMEEPPYTGGEAARDAWRQRVRDDAVAALTEPLDGVELGDYDRRMIEWLAGSDRPTIGTWVSLLHRARQAGRDEASR